MIVKRKVGELKARYRKPHVPTFKKSTRRVLARWIKSVPHKEGTGAER